MLFQPAVNYAHELSSFITVKNARSHHRLLDCVSALVNQCRDTKNITSLSPHRDRQLFRPVVRHRPWTRDVNANFSSRACRRLFGLTFELPTWRGHGRACGASLVEIHMSSPQMFNVVFSQRNCPRSTVPGTSTELHAATSSSPSTRKPSPPEQSIPTTRHDPHDTSHRSIRPVLSWRIEQATTTNHTSTDQTTDSVDNQIAADRLKLTVPVAVSHVS